MRDFRLTAILPVAVAGFLGFAPVRFVQRFYSIFDMNDVTVRDRFGMLRAGEHIVRDYPITGVGPEMIARVYPQYRAPDALLQITPHLHNVPLQIAAERGLPALAFWIWFIAAVLAGSWALFRSAPREGPQRFLAAAAIGAVVSMLGAGMFEHNFGDSEFLMLFVTLITLPFAPLFRDRRHHVALPFQKSADPLGRPGRVDRMGLEHNPPDAVQWFRYRAGENLVLSAFAIHL